MLHVIALRVQEVYDLVGVGLVTGCEDHQLEVLGQVGQEFPCAGADVHWSHHCASACELDGQLQLMRLAAVLEAVHQRLVQVEHHSHLVRVLLLPSQSQWLDGWLAACLLILGEELQEVDGVVEMVPGKGICVFVLFEYFCDVVAASWVVRILGQFLYLTLLLHVSHHLPDQLGVLRLVIRCNSIISLLLLPLPGLLILLVFQFAELSSPEVLGSGLEGRVVVGPSLPHEVELPAVVVALQRSAFLLFLHFVLIEKSLIACEVALGQGDESVELGTAQQILYLSLHLGILLVPGDDVVLPQFDDLGGESAMERTQSRRRFSLRRRTVFHLSQNIIGEL